MKKSVTVVLPPPPIKREHVVVADISYGQAFIGKVGAGPHSLYLSTFKGAVLLEDACRVWAEDAPVVDYTPVNIKITVVE